MRINRRATITTLTAWVIIITLLAGCSATKSISTSDTITPGATNTVITGLAPEAVKTLISLEKVDDYPLYVMHFAGPYDYPDINSLTVGGNAFGCSLYASLQESGAQLFGRNFDWEFSPALLVFTDPPDGYASASMVDLTFLGITVSDATSLTDLSLKERTNLLAAPALPFDGMNEYGLSIGMAALPGEYADDASYEAGKPSIGSIGVIRQVLDHARNVDEATEIFGQYNISFSGGPPIHYLVADRSGKAVLVEFYQGKMVLLPNENPWHLATNHLRCIAQGDGGCWRYRILSERLEQLNGQLNAQSSMQLLSEVKQNSTQWSAVYDMTSGDIQVVVGRDYATIHTFHLDLVKQ